VGGVYSFLDRGDDIDEPIDDLVIVAISLCVRLCRFFAQPPSRRPKDAL
jgi:hypothetical protein